LLFSSADDGLGPVLGQVGEVQHLGGDGGVRRKVFAGVVLDLLAQGWADGLGSAVAAGVRRGVSGRVGGQGQLGSVAQVMAVGDQIDPADRPLGMTPRA
jgi:3-oxoacyl-ACP reductase-like protein